MLVTAQMPPEFTLAVTAHAYVAPTEGGSRSPPPPTALPPVLFRRDDFAQEGPTGPIEAKQTLALSVGAEARLLVTFEVPERLVGSSASCRRRRCWSRARARAAALIVSRSQNFQ